MKKMEKTWQARGLCDPTMALSTTVINVAEVARTKLTASLLRTPKTAELKERHLSTLHHPLHQHGQCVCADDRERTYERATSPLPAMSPQQLCTQSSQSPSEYGSGDESDEHLDN